MGIERTADGDQQSVAVEEITVGLPEERPEAAGPLDRHEVNWHLVQSVQAATLRLLSQDRIERLLAEAIDTLQSCLGASASMLWLHDPIGQLDDAISMAADLRSRLRLTPDSGVLHDLVGDPADFQWLPATMAQDFGLFAGQSTQTEVLSIPLIDNRTTVGVLHFMGPQPGILSGESEMEVLKGFAELLPRLMARVLAMQATNALMLLDHDTHVANRTGFIRDLEREIGRAKRGKRTAALVAIALCDLDDLEALSRHHIQIRVFRQVANLIDAGLRATDSMGRVNARCFGIVIAEAQPDSLRDIAQRYEMELRGQTIDDGLGGFVEVKPRAGWVTLDPEDYPEKEFAELANLMLDRGIELTRPGIETTSEQRGLELKP